MILKPMVMDGKDAVWSMGDDTPLAPLARSPRPVYAFFRQRFAQVTNPPTDSLREARVLQLHTRLGPWPHMLDKHAPLSGLSLPSPFLSLAQMHDLRARQHALAGNLPLAVLECVFNPACNLVAALDDLCAKAIDLVRGGAAILLLTDRLAAPARSSRSPWPWPREPFTTPSRVPACAPSPVLPSRRATVATSTMPPSFSAWALARSDPGSHSKPPAA